VKFIVMIVLGILLLVVGFVGGVCNMVTSLF